MDNFSEDDNNISAARSLDQQSPAKFEIIFFACLFAFIAFLGVLGNCLVILAVGLDSKMRKSVMNILLLNLAAADLCNLIACAPDIAIQIMQSGWTLPPFTCPLLRYLEIVSLYCSLLTQLAVCIERFLAIAVPFKVHILCTMTKMRLWLAALWICGLIYAMPYFIYHRIERVPDHHNFNRCRFRAPPEILFYKSFECLIFYFLPLLIITLLYSRMVQILWWSSNQKSLIFMDSGGTPQNNKKISRPAKSGGGDKCLLTSGANDSSFNLTAENLQSRKNVVKMLISCVLIYFICYSPIQAIFIATFFHVKVETSFAINLILHCLAYGCSAANPLLYSIFSKKFRDKFHFLLNYWKSAQNTADRRENASNGSTSGIATGGRSRGGAAANGDRFLCAPNRKRLVVSLSPKGSSSRSGLEECQLLTDLQEPNTSQYNLSGSYGAIFRNAGAEDKSPRRSQHRVSFGSLLKK